MALHCEKSRPISLYMLMQAPVFVYLSPLTQVVYIFGILQPFPKLPSRELAAARVFLQDRERELSRTLRRGVFSVLKVRMTEKSLM